MLTLDISIKILLPYLNQEDCFKSIKHAKNRHQIAPLTTSKCKKLSLWEGRHPLPHPSPPPPLPRRLFLPPPPPPPKKKKKKTFKSWLRHCTHLKYVGVVIDQHMDWAKHIDCIGKKIPKDIYLMTIIRPYITQQTALTFYKSVIQRRFDYWSVIWGNAGKGSLDNLHKLQNRALRIVLQVDWSSSSDLLRVLKVDDLSDRRDKHVLHMMHKIAHELIPGEFLKYFAPNEYHYGLRNARKCFEIPKHHTNFKKRALSYRGIKNWNKIPIKIKEMSYSTFKWMSRWPVYTMKRYAWLNYRYLFSCDNHIVL